jgi:uncharacterized protein (DUF2252 family)
MQAVPPGLLEPVCVGKASYVVRAVEPEEDRVSLSAVAGRPKALQRLVVTIAQLAAWGQLRSAARGGASLPAALVQFGAADGWRSYAVDYAEQYSRQVHRDWQTFRNAHRQTRVEAGSKRP